MPVLVTIEQIARLAPRVRPGYRDGFGGGQELLGRFGISDAPLRVAHFIAQLMHESGGMTREVENLNYSAKRLVQVWPWRFEPHGPLDPALYANNPRKLANEVYGGRMGNTGPDDGYLFRGRGLLQLTGKENYAGATRKVRHCVGAAPDFTKEPDAVIAPEWCVAVAAAEWASRGCNELADADDLEQITRRINGGTTGFPDREAWLRQAKAVWL